MFVWIWVHFARLICMPVVISIVGHTGGFGGLDVAGLLSLRKDV